MSNSKPDYNLVEVPLRDLSPLVLECLAQGQEIILTVTGNSMSPFLRHQRDQVVLTPCDPTALQPGMIPFYRRENGQYVMHRIVERDDGKQAVRFGCKAVYPSAGNGLQYTMMGDAQSYIEPGIRPEQIVARATAFIRMGKRVECDSSSYLRHRRLWHRLLPLRKTFVWLDRRLEWRFRRLFPYKER